VLFHGHGASGADLAALEERFADRVPDAVWLRPDAPFSVADGLTPEEVAAVHRARPDVSLEERRTWAAPGPASEPPPGARGVDARTLFGHFVKPVEASLDPAVSAVRRLIDAELARLGLDDSALALYGFSQGGLAALHVGLTRPRPCACVVSHSGQFFGLSEVRSTPPVLLLVGEHELEDGKPGKHVFPYAVEALREAGVEVEQYTAKGLGHGSSRRSDVVTCRYIERAFQNRGQ
jgi:phospholipase/carboxylesterase